MTKRRSNKKLTQEDIESIESFNITRKSENNVSNNIFTQIKIDVKPKTENQKKLLQAIKDNEIIITSGFPGTGKTFLACAEALKLLKNHELPFKKIILVKSVTTLKDEEIGFLKGTMEEIFSNHQITI